MSIECVGDAGSSGDAGCCPSCGETVGETTSNTLLWNGRGVEVSIEKHNKKLTLLKQFYIQVIQERAAAFYMENQAHEYHLLDLDEEPSDSIDSAYALDHYSHHVLALLDRQIDQVGNIQCKSFLKRVIKETKKGFEKTGKFFKKGAKKAGKVFWNHSKSAVEGAGHIVKKGVEETGKALKKAADETIDFITDHKKELLIGTALLAVGIGVYYTMGALAASTAESLAAGAVAGAQGFEGTGKRRREEDVPLDDPGSRLLAGSSPPDKDSPSLTMGTPTQEEKSLIEGLGKYSTPQITPSSSFSSPTSDPSTRSTISTVLENLKQRTDSFGAFPLSSHESMGLSSSTSNPFERLTSNQGLFPDASPLVPSVMRTLSERERSYMESFDWATSLANSLPEQTQAHIEDLITSTFGPAFAVNPPPEQLQPFTASSDFLEAPSIDSDSDTSFKSIISSVLDKIGQGINTLTSKIAPSLEQRLREMSPEALKELLQGFPAFRNVLPIEEVLEKCPGLEGLVTTPTKSCYMKLEGIELPGVRIGFIPGMNTSYEESLSHLRHIQKISGGMSIEGVYNHSNGCCGDIIEIFCFGYPGVSPITADQALEDWTQFHEENRDNPYAKYLQKTHSMGNIIARNALLKAPQEIRDRVIILAIAPAIVILEDLCYASFHYASEKDFVHLGEELFTLLIGNDPEENKIEAAERFLENKERLVRLKPHPKSVGMDHDFESLTFVERIDDHIKEYLKNNGQYK